VLIFVEFLLACQSSQPWHRYRREPIDPSEYGTW
jgi:hypothetical protein